MAFISATRLRLKSFINLPAFLLANEAAAKEIINTPGLLGGKELIDKHLTFWTISIWEDMDSMKKFRNSIPHRKAMQKLPDWCSEASYVHWEQEETETPSWNEIYSNMIAEGKPSKVRHPSSQHLSNSYPPPIWTKLERVFKPKAVRASAL